MTEELASVILTDDEFYLAEIKKWKQQFKEQSIKREKELLELDIKNINLMLEMMKDRQENFGHVYGRLWTARIELKIKLIKLENL